MFYDNYRHLRLRNPTLFPPLRLPLVEGLLTLDCRFVQFHVVDILQVLWPEQRGTRPEQRMQCVSIPTACIHHPGL